MVSERSHEGRGKAHLLKSDDAADDHRVQKNGRQGRQPLLAAPCGEDSGEQRGKGAEDHVQRPVGTQEIGDHTAHKESPSRDGVQKGQHGQRLREAALNDTEGQVEGIAEVAQHHIDGGHNGGEGQFAGRNAFHVGIPPFFV